MLQVDAVGRVSHLPCRNSKVGSLHNPSGGIQSAPVKKSTNLPLNSWNFLLKDMNKEQK